MIFTNVTNSTVFKLNSCGVERESTSSFSHSMSTNDAEGNSTKKGGEGKKNKI
jgi:hypothetical protein